MHLDHLDKICIKDLRVRCIVGLYPIEMIEAQPLHLDLTLYVDTRKAAHSTNLNDSIDYAGIATQTEFILKNGRFKLIETAAEAVAHNILASQYFENTARTIEAVKVVVRKPEALSGKGIPEIHIERSRDEIAIHRLHLGSGERIVFKANQHFIIRHLIPSRSRITLEKPPLLSIHDMFLGRSWHDGQNRIAHEESLKRMPGSRLQFYNQSMEPAVLISLVAGPTSKYKLAKMAKLKRPNPNIHIVKEENPDQA